MKGAARIEKRPGGKPGPRAGRVGNSERRRGRLDPSLVAVLRAAAEWQGRIESALSAIGLSAAKFETLQHLATAEEPLALSELAERASCVRSNITQLVDRLEAEALVGRLDDPGDRRVIRAQLTALGKERYAAGARIVEGVSAEFASAIPAGDRATLERLLGRLR